MVDLKPCPFCENNPIQPENQNSKSAKKPFWVIRCSHFCISMNRNSLKTVVNDWNIRAQNNIAKESDNG